MNINAEFIKNQRTQRNWTQQVLAESCDVSLRTIQRVERYGNASQETVMALSAVLEVPQESIVVPEVPVVELDMTKDSEAKMPTATLQFAGTFVAGIVIGAIAMMIVG